MSVLLLYSVIPNTIESATSEYIKSNIGNFHFDFKYINTILLFLFLWVWMQYCQIVLTIESLYGYIHKLEQRMSQYEPEIDRESKSYLSNYPWLKDFVNFLFKALFPLIVICTSVVKFLQEIHNVEIYNVSIDILFMVLVVIVSLLYISHRFFHEESFKKEHKNNSFWKRFVWYFKGVPNTTKH